MGGSLGDVAARLRQHAEHHEVLVVEALVEHGRGGGLLSAVDAAEMLAIIEATGPSLLYLVETTFNVDAAIEEALAETEEEAAAAIGLTAGLEALRQRHRRRNGETDLVVAATMVDGVLHVMTLREPWLASFNEELDLLVAAERAEREAVRRRAGIAARSALEPQARELAAHKAFPAGRSFERRRYLAERLFPDLDDQQLTEVTQRADELAWFDKHAAD